MNKLKTLVAGIALAFSAGVANAAIESGAPAFGGSTDGELFLNVYNVTDQKTFTLDTGWHFSDFTANPTSFSSSFGGDANWNTFTSFVDAGDQLVFNLVGRSDVLTGGAGNPRQRYITSSDSLTPIFGTSTTSTNVLNAIVDRVIAINGKAGDNADFAANLTTFSNAGEAADYADKWGSNFNGFNGSFDNDTDVGNYLALFSVVTTGGGFSQPAATVTGTQLGFAFLNLGQGTLSIASQPPSAVPVPPALWLMGSAMTALVGFSRRRNA